MIMTPDNFNKIYIGVFDPPAKQNDVSDEPGIMKEYVPSLFELCMKP